MSNLLSAVYFLTTVQIYLNNATPVPTSSTQSPVIVTSPKYDVSSDESNVNVKSPIKDLESVMKLVFNEITPKINHLEEKYVYRRFKSPAMRDYIRDTTQGLKGLTEELLGNPQDFTDLDISQSNEIIEWLQTSVIKFRLVASYLQLASRESRGHFRHQFEAAADQAENVFSILSGLLDNLNLPHHVLSLTENPLPEMMHLGKYRHLKHLRDYLIIRDYLRYLDLFEWEIDSLKMSTIKTWREI